MSEEIDPQPLPLPLENPVQRPVQNGVPEVAPTVDPRVSDAGVRKRGGQPGNLNAAVHLAYSRRKVRDQRDRSRRQAEARVRGILKEHGLEHSETGLFIGCQVRRLETAAARHEAHFDKRGWHDKKGEIKASAQRWL